MGITARGAWEAVKRHFREIDTDIQSEPFTVIGVGDMSGDVFGNGMLLSKTIKLVAAFDHRDIFIDPNPDPGKSWRERKRLFDLGRSSWQDYGKSLISKGGGVISRRDKSVKLSADMKKLLGLRKAEARPNEVINAILKLKADLLWFGGIGTYVRAEDESDLEVGDKANDAIRITTGELGVKVIGEGANLGLTQRARIAFGLKGGRCNSDAIDNSAGVNSSDMEVNIKIALAAALRSNKLTMGARDTLLKKMTDEVAALVLRNN
jgi:glutamate dehydrogenase